MNAIFGVTPLESAATVIGMTNASAVMNFLFKTSGWGAIAFGIGFYLKITDYLKTQNFSHVTNYFILCFFVLIVFVLPNTDVNRVSSTMEEAGNYSEVSSQDLYKTFGLNESIPTVLLLINKTLDSISYGIINTIESLGDNDGFEYLKSPFLMNKVMVQMGRFLDAGVEDKELKSRLDKFILNEYLPAINKMEETKEISTDNAVFLWPGKFSVVKHYSTKGKKEWEDIRTSIIEYIESDPIVKKHFDQYSSKTKKFLRKDAETSNLTDEDMLVLQLLNKDLLQRNGLVQMDTKNMFSQEILYSGGALPIDHKWIVKTLSMAFAWAGQIGADFFTRTAQYYFLLSLPFIQGLATIILYSLFPVTLIFMLIYGSINYLGHFLRFLIYLKTWTVTLAIVNISSKYLMIIQAKLSPTADFLYTQSLYNATISIFMLSTPFLSNYFVNGMMGGIESLAGRVSSSYVGIKGLVSKSMGYIR